jgi:hypothetical protein
MKPLADLLRPQKLSEIIGQKHIIGEDKLLYKSIKSGNIFSMIFLSLPAHPNTKSLSRKQKESPLELDVMYKFHYKESNFRRLS